MRITLDELKQLEQPDIDLLEILSLEGQQYMARLHARDGMKVLSDKHGKTRLFRSAWQLQDTLSGFSIRETQVVHASAYHEMVGMTPAQIDPLRIQVQRERS